MIPDALNAIRMRLKRKDLLRAVKDDSLADKILGVVEDIYDYQDFINIMDLGLNFSVNDLPFDKVLVYSWIKEGLNSGRKT